MTFCWYAIFVLSCSKFAICRNSLNLDIIWIANVMTFVYSFLFSWICLRKRVCLKLLSHSLKVKCFFANITLWSLVFLIVEVGMIGIYLICYAYCFTFNNLRLDYRTLFVADLFELSLEFLWLCIIADFPYLINTVTLILNNIFRALI